MSQYTNMTKVALSDDGFGIFDPTPELMPKWKKQFGYNLRAFQSDSKGIIDCTDHYTRGEAWKCGISSAVAQFVKSPIFLVQNQLDFFSLNNFCDVSCFRKHKSGTTKGNICTKDKVFSCESECCK